MKSITIDDEKYYLASEVDKKLKAKKPRQQEQGLELLHPNMPMDSTNVMALGTLKIKGKWAMTSFSLDYMKIIIDTYKKMGRDSMIIAWTNDYPIIVGHRNETDKETISGFILAPRIENEET